MSYCVLPGSHDDYRCHVHWYPAFAQLVVSIPVYAKSGLATDCAAVGIEDLMRPAPDVQAAIVPPANLEETVAHHGVALVAKVPVSVVRDEDVQAGAGVFDSNFLIRKEWSAMRAPFLGNPIADSGTSAVLVLLGALVRNEDDAAEGQHRRGAARISNNAEKPCPRCLHVRPHASQCGQILGVIQETIRNQI
jgi:hypothetical protein